MNQGETMKLDFALEVLKKEYGVNKEFDLSKVPDRLTFLCALTIVEQSLNIGTLKESDYLNKVAGVME